MDDTKAIPLQAYLIIERSGKIYPLEQPIFNIGRSMENDLVFDDPSVSRHHAQLRALHGHYEVFDLSSRAGTFVNGERIQQAVLYPGDVICVAAICCTYQEGDLPPRPDLNQTVEGLPSLSSH